MSDPGVERDRDYWQGEAARLRTALEYVAWWMGAKPKVELIDHIAQTLKTPVRESESHE